MVWVLAAGFVILLGGLIAFFLRSNGSGGGQTRTTDDGFFVRGFPTGSRIRWRAYANGGWRNGVAEIAGDETFVYTGGSPSEIQIESAGEALSAPVSSGPPSSDDDVGGGGFDGFPSAY
jgi:hypothetical protein